MTNTTHTALTAATAALAERRAEHRSACDLLEMSQDTGLPRRIMRGLEKDCHTAYDAVVAACAAEVAAHAEVTR